MRPSPAVPPAPQASSRGAARGRTRLANNAWEAAFTAHSTLMKQFAADDVWAGLSMREYDVLYTLSKSGVPQRLGDLSGHVLLSQPGLSRLVDRLVERGLVARCVDPTDARAANLTLTDEGRALQRRIGRAHGASVAAAMTARLTDEELALLEALSLKLVSDPDSLPEEHP
ncbi:MarR family winged helix-turn-helix transcriptional regulator [Demequina phytophila]|uniref:MarR family winged helix-turn-helix transcriptional regulator n=1 Tax=Demequina phytophila TaxID=1638981 RepID=UPI0009E5EF16|nr:MarR family transcriptional regulator [Demequina phytophila]